MFTEGLDNNALRWVREVTFIPLILTFFGFFFFLEKKISLSKLGCVEVISNMGFSECTLIFEKF